MKCSTSKNRNGLKHRAKFALEVLVACIFLGMAAAPGYCSDDNNLSRPPTGEGPTKVSVGIYLADLFEISASDQSFLADVVVRAEWLDARLAGRWTGVHGIALVDVWNPNLQLLNQRAVKATLPLRVEVDSSGRVRWQQRWIGRFSARMDLRDFPLDRQRFQVQIVSLGYTPNDVELVINSKTVQSGRANDLSITEWAVGPTSMETANFTPAPGAKELVGARLWWEARRYIGYQAVQVIFPLVLIVLMGWAAFWLDPSVVPARLSVAMTTMLTLIAYRFALGRSVPNLTYLTRFDYFMLASTLLTFLTLLFVAVGAHLVAKGQLPQVHRLDRWARLGFPAAFGLAFVLAWWG
jgi:hypothetical protein